MLIRNDRTIVMNVFEGELHISCKKNWPVNLKIFSNTFSWPIFPIKMEKLQIFEEIDGLTLSSFLTSCFYSLKRLFLFVPFPYLRTQTIETSSLPTNSSWPLFKQRFFSDILAVYFNYKYFPLYTREFKGVDKSWNTEHAGPFRNIPEHPGTWKNKNNFHEKKYIIK